MKQTYSQDSTVADHFVTFATKFFYLAKSQYQQQNQIRVNTVAFHALIILQELEGGNFTMSQLAEELCITKQQLTKLVNDMEEKGLVERVHNQENRRQVYIRITSLGQHMLDDLKTHMRLSTQQAMEAYTEEELQEMDRCLVSLTKLLKKFNCPPQN